VSEGGGPALVVVTGHPATGKTTLAQALATELGCVLVAKDALKERLFDVLGGGDEEWSHLLGRAAMYLLYDQVEAVLAAGVPVVAEANFVADLAGPELAAVVERTGAPVVQVVLDAPPEVLAERFRSRIDSGERHPGHPDQPPDVHPGLFPPYEPPDLPGPTVLVDCTDLAAVDPADVAATVSALLDP
jgi:predicted kinase